jgi:hypothetical protein
VSIHNEPDPFAGVQIPGVTPGLLPAGFFQAAEQPLMSAGAELSAPTDWARHEIDGYSFTNPATGQPWPSLWAGAEPIDSPDPQCVCGAPWDSEMNHCPVEAALRAKITAELDVPALQAQIEQLTYERQLLGAVRRHLDEIADPQGRYREDAIKTAGDLAQRIVDEIGHPVTDEPALGPGFREQIAELLHERDQLVPLLVAVGDVVRQIRPLRSLTAEARALIAAWDTRHTDRTEDDRTYGAVTKTVADMIEHAWNIIANVGVHVHTGGWDAQHPSWVDAAKRWRDERYHPWLRYYCDTHPQAAEHPSWGRARWLEEGASTPFPKDSPPPAAAAIEALARWIGQTKVLGFGWDDPGDDDPHAQASNRGALIGFARSCIDAVTPFLRLISVTGRELIELDLGAHTPDVDNPYTKVFMEEGWQVLPREPVHPQMVTRPKIHIVVTPAHGLWGCFFDGEFAHRMARELNLVVAEVPITADYREVTS